MLDKINDLLKEIKELSAASAEEAEQLRIKYLSKKGIIPQLFNEFKTVPNEQKKVIGQAINQLKSLALEKINNLKEQFEQSQPVSDVTDLTLPGTVVPLGSRHPLSIIRQQITNIFGRIGFSVAEGPEIEDDWHVFEALNFPPEHPARDMQDTFFITQNPDILLRTHTSSVQIRTMEQQKPPIRAIFPGRVFRNEAISARAHCIFHQVEGLYIDKDVSFADLRQTLLYFAKEMFGQDTRIRLRPSYFPFTEPSAEMDISCTLCGGKGCNICKHTGWVEILGCGMVDPAVLSNCKIDPHEYTGFAFGMGIERIAMLKYQINDIRLFFENDIRFIKQFKAES
ncbi:phenylalanine--tRNA ligase subunit alpha [Thermophagus xiamenensis]|uniref:Phenylalanine--tRNA ligase alpha subunit n=1 Tax=Thermophagus xiamenensis TaxID=385682 RepID=A0A1I2CI05_9BACT|nr:phenylalanine--tRNA ligase subunit alpha [Thermophagus xiamenensis]SFE67977.1 phenylalanyl-tRNA synthetase, alpha subunit [Thermophagus xiamenensis]